MNQHLERIAELAPFLRQPALTLIQRCELKLKRKLLVVSCWRSVREQLLNYQKGRTFDRASGIWTVADKALVVTNAPPGTTPHNVISKQGEAASMAMDVIPLLETGAPDWEVDGDFWDALYELAWKVGLDPLGDPIGSYLAGDMGHFEEPCWKLKLEGLGLLLPVAEPVTL